MNKIEWQTKLELDLEEFNQEILKRDKTYKKYFSKNKISRRLPKIQSRKTMSIPKSGVRSNALGPLTSSSFEIGFWRQKFQKILDTNFVYIFFS